MKTLSEHDLEPEDSFWLYLTAAVDPQAPQESELEPLLQALEEYADGWMPDVVKGTRGRKYSRPSFWKSLAEGRKWNTTLLGLYRTKWPALDVCLDLNHPPLPPQLNISIKVTPLSFFAEAERCRQFIEMVRAWASRYPVTHATAHSSDDMNLADSPHFGRGPEIYSRDGFDKIYEVCWLNVFGPELVRTVGRERMLSTPAWRLEELPNGCILLVTWPTASDFTSDAARLAQARAHAHLRPDLDFDSVLRSLRERSAALAPVQPRFHPDMAPLLSRMVDTVATFKRQRLISEFNSWLPPEPDEWAPASSALALDVDDPRAALEHYDTLAEHLVALRHTLVPSVFSASPASLSDLDFSFWEESFPTRYLPDVIESLAIPAVGAYLGMVLVRHLGGRWLPRKQLSQAQVLVGSRVWFPFLRARHYLLSRQSLLDYSLSWLFRVASLHLS